MRKQKRADCQQTESVLFHFHGESFRSLTGESPGFIRAKIVHIHQLEGLSALNRIFAATVSCPNGETIGDSPEQFRFTQRNIGDRNMERTVICNAKAIAFGGERQFRHRVIQRAFQRSGPVKSLIRDLIAS